jgi:hypothetical protein
MWTTETEVTLANTDPSTTFNDHQTERVTMITKNLTITPAAGLFGLRSVTADQEHVGWVYPAHDLTWIAVNILGDETEGFPTKIDAAGYISNNGAE